MAISAPPLYDPHTELHWHIAWRVDGEARRLMYHVKFARGLMARWIMQNRVEKAADLRDFDAEGYKFDAKASADGELVFSRKQPPLKQ